MAIGTANGGTSSSSVIPADSNPCLVALNRVELVFVGPVDFFELRRLADPLFVMIFPLLSSRSAFQVGCCTGLSSDAAYAQPQLRWLPVAQVRTVASGINLFLEAIAQVCTVAKAPGGYSSFN
jgi:hypothetical protein